MLSLPQGPARALFAIGTTMLSFGVVTFLAPLSLEPWLDGINIGPDSAASRFLSDSPVELGRFVAWTASGLLVANGLLRARS